MKPRSKQLTDEQLAWAMRAWWNERIVDGCQLEFMKDAAPRTDFMGDGRWKRRVAMLALHRDFCRSRNMHPSVPQFTYNWNRATQCESRVMRLAPYTTPGGLQGKRLVLFVRFGKAPLTPLPT